MQKEKKKQLHEQEEILIEIEAAKQRLQTLLINLEYITEPELLDSLIYELKAVSGRYQYLLKIAKNFRSS